MNQFFPVWGFTYQGRVRAIDYEQENFLFDLKESKKFSGIIRKGNAWKVVGYIPGLNIVTGTITIIFFRTNGIFKNYPSIRKKYTCRGFAMIIGGPLLFFPDLGVTVFREVKTVRPALENAKNSNRFKKIMMD